MVYSTFDMAGKIFACFVGMFLSGCFSVLVLLQFNQGFDSVVCGIVKQSFLGDQMDAKELVEKVNKKFAEKLEITDPSGAMTETQFGIFQVIVWMNEELEKTEAGGAGDGRQA